MSLADRISLGVAVGTAALALATMFLALYTRSAVKEAAEARKTWASMAQDATRARMDASAPQVTVSSLKVSQELWAEPTLAMVQGTFGNRWPPSHTWVFDKDTENLVCTKLTVNIIGGSSLPIHIEFEGQFSWNGMEDGRSYYNMAGSESLSVEMHAAFTAQQWSENYQAHITGQKPPHVSIAKIYMVDRSENGVTDSWELSLSGWPLEPVPGNIAQWRMARQGVGGSSAYDISPRRRTYFLSRAQDVTLPDSFAPPVTDFWDRIKEYSAKG